MPFQFAVNKVHQAISQCACLEMWQQEKWVLNSALKLYSPHRNILQVGMTWEVNCRNPVSSSSLVLVQDARLVEVDKSSARYSSLSVGRRTSIAWESNSSPRNGRSVDGPSILYGKQDLPAHFYDSQAIQHVMAAMYLS